MFLGFIVKNNKLLKPKIYFQPLSFSLIFFSLIGTTQFLLGRTIGGPFYLLGERVFSLATPGISLFTLFGKEYLRAYSTFPHPNALSGYFLVAVLILFSFSFKKYKKLFYTALFFAVAGIAISFSMATALGAILVLVLYLIFKKNKELFKKLVIFFFFISAILSLVSPVFLQKNKQFFEGAQETYFKRFALTLSAGEIISKNPFGIGLNNFLLELPGLSLYPKVSWWIQPVHNVFLLVLSETGLIGLLVFLYLFYKSLINTFTRKSPAFTLAIIVVLLTGLFDHYWLTLQQNEILLSILLGLSLRKNKR